MRIAVYLPSIAPTAGGGFTFQQSVLEGLIALAPQSSHEFFLYTAGDPGVSLPPNMRVVPLNATTGSRIRSKAALLARELQGRYLGKQLLGTSSWLERSVRELGIHVCWFTTPHFEECGVPFVYTVWDLQHVVQPWFPEVSNGTEWTSRDALYRRTIVRAVRTIVANGAARDEVMRAFGVPEDRLLLLPHPAPRLDPPTAEAIEGVRRKYALQTDYLFYPAQFWPHKNHANLLLALKELRDSGSALSLVLCGSDKGNEAWVRTMARDLGLSAHVHFLGFVPDHELAALYAGAYALAFVSFFGPENIPPLEAFATGCPVICSDYAGAREQLGDAALYVPPADPRSIADAVRAMPAQRAMLIARGRARAGRWTGIDYSERVLAFFDEFAAIRRCWP